MEDNKTNEKRKKKSRRHRRQQLKRVLICLLYTSNSTQGYQHQVPDKASDGGQRQEGAKVHVGHSRRNGDEASHNGDKAAEENLSLIHI